MGLKTTFTSVGADEAQQKRIHLAVAKVLDPGAWQGDFIGAQENDRWVLHLRGPSTDVRINLEGADGEHSPKVIAERVASALAQR